MNQRSGGKPERRTSGSGQTPGQGRGRPERTQGKPTGSGAKDSKRGRREDGRGDNRGPRRDWSRKEMSTERTTEQATYDGPEIPEHITGRELDRNIAGQLKSLPEKLALRVARHLVAAGEALEVDPKTAYQHTLAARARAGRLAVIREAVGEAAYAAGEYAEALSELKSARRMNGSSDYLAVMADCERALGRPDRALTMLRGVKTEDLSPELRAELVIVEAGARRDRKEFDAALRVLELAPLQSRARAPWVVRLRYAYADTLAAAGRTADAQEWFHRTAAIDQDEITDALERINT